MKKRGVRRRLPADIEIAIQTYNPYEAWFPGRKVVTREQLLLIKQLRSQGAIVTILPKGSRAVEYVFRKGFVDLVKDPMFIFCANIPISIVCGLISSAILKVGKALGKGFGSRIAISPTGAKHTLTPGGLVRDPKWAVSVQQELVENNKAFELAMRTGSPFPDKPVPLFLEHTAIIVGWGRATFENDKIILQGESITDHVTELRLANDELRGLSIAGIATESVCSICRGDYFLCSHVAGKFYDGLGCSNTIKKALLAEFSLVRDPVNAECIPRLRSLLGSSHQMK
jgi:hypothetical protein